MKAIMISVRPEWVVKILNGEKTIEIRKTMPKCELPVKCYIYCTADNKICAYNLNTCKYEIMNKEKYRKTFSFDINRQVVAEFTLNKVTKHEKNYIDVEDRLCYNFMTEDVKNAGFVNSEMDEWEKLDAYINFDRFVSDYGNGKPLYVWHIEDLKIYDEPKELSEFSAFIPNNECNEDCTKCNAYNKEYNTCLACMNLCKRLKRPPQSWCYVEEIENDCQ